MKKEDIQALFEEYEHAVCEVNGIECWSARDLQKLLEYSLWQNFINVINKAKEACENVGQPKSDHFIDVNKMIVAGKGAQREVMTSCSLATPVISLLRTATHASQ